MKLSKMKLKDVNFETLDKAQLKSIVAGQFPDCEDIIWIKLEDGTSIPVCANMYQGGTCLGLRGPSDI